jgi:hypothetical protein
VPFDLTLTHLQPRILKKVCLSLFPLGLPQAHPGATAVLVLIDKFNARSL